MVHKQLLDAAGICLEPTSGSVTGFPAEEVSLVLLVCEYTCYRANVYAHRSRTIHIPMNAEII